MEIIAWAVSLLVRGRFVVRDGALTGAKGEGRYLAR
jgi:dihydropyrimidinase